MNDYTWWEDAVGGNRRPISSDNPMPGFYRLKTHDKRSWRPVAYWYDQDGLLHCHADGRTCDDYHAHTMWPSASMNPVTHEVYLEAIKTGKWPDMNEAVVGHNAAPVDDTVESIKDRIEDLAREAERMIKAGAAPDQDTVDQASDLANTLGELAAKAVALHDIEKKPCLDEGRFIDNKWFGLRDRAGDLKRMLKNIVVFPFLDQKRAEAEAARIAAIGEGTAIDAIPDVRVVAGSSKRATAIRTRKRAKITDQDAFYAHVKNQEQVKLALQDMADALARAGVKAPGMEIVVERSAA